MKTEDDSRPDPFVNVKKEAIQSDKINSKYRCQKCGKSLSSSRTLRRHTQCFHAEGASTNQVDIKSEPKTDDDSNENETSCRECNKAFANRDDYLKHKINHKKTFECDVCQKIFRTRLHLKVHFPTHMEIKPFLCDVCSRPFARANNLRRHKLTHVVDKRFVCETCGRRFPGKIN